MIKNCLIICLCLTIIVLQARKPEETIKDAFFRVGNNIYIIAFEIVYEDKQKLVVNYED